MDQATLPSLINILFQGLHNPEKYLPKLANNYNEGYEMGIINLIVPREEKAPESPLHVASLGYSIKSSPIGVVSF